MLPSPNSNVNSKPNPDPDGGAIFLGGNFADTQVFISYSKISLIFSQLPMIYCKYEFSETMQCYWGFFYYRKLLNDTDMKKLGLYTELSTKIHWYIRLAASDDSICLHNQLSSFNSSPYRCLKNVIHQINSKNRWLLLSVTFTAKLELVLS